MDYIFREAELEIVLHVCVLRMLCIYTKLSVCMGGKYFFIW